jgi:hypothetical protein
VSHHVINLQLIKSAMGKRKAKKTLTKIDPGILRPKPTVSQHAASNGACVTTIVNPTLRTPVDPVAFTVDMSTFDEGYLEGDDGGGGGDSKDDEVSKGYYIARVHVHRPTFYSWKLITSRTTRSY